MILSTCVITDEEWGRPMHDDTRLFEKLCLEGFQAGLSWMTIPRIRPAFREAFANFKLPRVAKFNQRDDDKLGLIAGVIRHRGEIESTTNHAQRAIELTSEKGSLAEYFWECQPRKSAKLRSTADVVATTVADGHSSDPRRATPSCNQWAWSTITSSDAHSQRLPTAPKGSNRTKAVRAV